MPHAPTKTEDGSVLYWDFRDKVWTGFPRTLLPDRFASESPRIAANFDALLSTDLLEISTEMAQTLTLLLRVSEEAPPQETGQGIAYLVNATQNVMAAIELLRGGYYLQPAMMFRPALELICAAMFVSANPSRLSDVHDGAVKTRDLIRHAKKTLPHIGLIFGTLSESFMHIGDMHHASWQFLDHKKRVGPQTLNLVLARHLVWMTSVAAEAVLFRYVEKPRYWRIDGPRLTFDPSPAELQRQAEFVRLHELVQDRAGAWDGSGTASPWKAPEESPKAGGSDSNPTQQPVD